MWVSVLVQYLLRGYENLNCLVFWFSVQLTSHVLFFFLLRNFFSYEIWIIVWIWAFFFLLTSLGSFHMEKLIWASKTKSYILGSQNLCWFVLKGPKRQGGSLFSSSFLGNFFQLFSNLYSEITIDADLIPHLYNL